MTTTVDGTPDEVWELIATGPGISVWFLPAIVEQHVGGRPGEPAGHLVIESWRPGSEVTQDERR